MQKKLLHIFSFILMAALSACTNNAPEVDDTGYIDIVSFVSTTSNTTTFEFQRINDDPMVRYVAQDITVDTTFMPRGTRLILAYAPISGEAYKSGYIHVLGMQPIVNSDVTPATISDSWNKETTTFRQMWRAGSLINTCVSMQTQTELTKFELVVDSKTIDNPCPDLYLIVNYDYSNKSEEKACYASFDMSEVWNKPSCQGVTIHIADINEKNKTITFNKSVNN